MNICYIVINRLRIENSHAISKSNELQSKASLLQRTLKHSKQQYSILENENKKLQKHNKYLKGRLNDIDSPTNTNQRDDDTMSIVSLRSQIQSLQDTHRIGAVKQKKVYCIYMILWMFFFLIHILGSI